jgi:hypothetical protein
VSYSDDSDLYAFGLPRGATPNPGRELFSLLSNTCTLDVHGFATGDEILFRAAGAGSLPAELTAGVTYYAQRESEHTFRVRATAEGTALAISDATDPLVVIAPLPIAAARQWADAIIDDALTGHAVPLDPVPALVRMTSAELTAAKLGATSGATSKSLSETVDAALKRLERWRVGKPVDGAALDSHDNLAQLGAAAGPTATACLSGSESWRRFGGL